ncbi:MAG: hypothetical protein LBH32_07685, partial [Dysgonamonadaceae bacterium]|nr:hypothetical protein [Dysgonamonadaceae bacterium]
KTTKTTVPKTEQEKPATTASRAENKIQEKSKRKINYLIMLGLGSNGPSVLAGAKMMNNAFSYGAYIKYKYSVNNYQYTYSYYDYYYDYYGHYYDDTRTQDIKVASKSFIFGFLTGYRNLFMNIGIGYYNCGYRYGEHFEKYSNDDGIEFDLGLIYKIGIFGVGVGIGTVPSLSGFDSKTDVLFNFSAGFIF